VEVDGHRVARGLGGACVVALVALAAVLFGAGAHKNAQITSLRHHGVPVEVTVTKCVGLLGGSGSNSAGHTCRGSFVLDERRYSVTIPGSTLRAPGTKVRVVAAENDPGLIATVHQLENEHTSWKVFVLPTVLLVMLAAFLGLFATLRRRDRGAARSAGTSPRARLRRRQPLLG
jgi:hypothetical protein